MDPRELKIHQNPVWPRLGTDAITSALPSNFQATLTPSFPFSPFIFAPSFHASKVASGRRSCRTAGVEPDPTVLTWDESHRNEKTTLSVHAQYWVSTSSEMYLPQLSYEPAQTKRDHRVPYDRSSRRVLCTAGNHRKECSGWETLTSSFAGVTPGLPFSRQPCPRMSSLVLIPRLSSPMAVNSASSFEQSLSPLLRFVCKTPFEKCFVVYSSSPCLVLAAACPGTVPVPCLNPVILVIVDSCLFSSLSHPPFSFYLTNVSN